MLRRLKDIEGYGMRATDGDIGTVKDFYFDDTHWTVRYLVIETGSWLSSRKVLISPMSLGTPDYDAEMLTVSVTREQVKNSPDIDTDRPVSRQHEVDYLDYYGYPAYWEGGSLWGTSAVPGMMLPESGVAAPGALGAATDAEDGRAIAAARAAREQNEDPHLQSCDDVAGYHIKARDGEIGHVSDFVVDDANWTIRYLVVDTSNWWGGHKVLVSPRWIRDVSWAESIVAVDMTQDEIRAAPEWDPSKPIEREHEIDIHRHYQRSGYW